MLDGVDQVKKTVVQVKVGAQGLGDQVVDDEP